MPELGRRFGERMMILLFTFAFWLLGDAAREVDCPFEALPPLKKKDPGQRSQSRVGPMADVTENLGSPIHNLSGVFQNLARWKEGWVLAVTVEPL